MSEEIETAYKYFEDHGFLNARELFPACCVVEAMGWEPYLRLVPRGQERNG